MKIKILKFGMMVFTVVSLTSCKNENPNQTVEIDTPAEVKQAEKQAADIADESFMDGMTGKVWHNYLQIKMALTKGDAETVKDIAGDMADSFSEERAAMKTIAQQMADTDDLEKQRELFAQLTEKVGPMFEDALSAGTIYKKFCPMAFNNKGAYWYESVKEIKNPYFGDKMLTCGSIDKTIEKQL